MNKPRLPVTIACAALLVAATAAAGPIYKWVDDDGNVHYEDRPIGESSLARVNIASRGTDDAAVQARVDARRKAQAAADQVASEAPEEMSREDLRAEQQARQEKCESYRAKLQTFLASPRMYKEDEAGERVYLDDSEIMAARSQVEEKIREYCGAL